MKNTNTTKIGQGYYQSGYGRGFKKNPIVRLINGKAYVKDSTQTPFQTDMEGYVMVNALKTGDQTFFAAVGLISQHEQYNLDSINCIHLTKKIIDMIDFASHQLMIGNIARGNFYLNVVKCLIQDNKNTNIWVSREFIDKAEKEVSNWN
jgi:hypothetical protein